MTFFDYIENLASRHVDIQHDPKNAVHFLSSESSKHTAMDSELCYPAIIVDRGAGFSFSGGAGSYYRDSLYVLLIISNVADTSDYEEIDTTIETCEKILHDILRKMMDDKRSLRLLKGFRLEDTECEYIENVDMQQYGVMALLPVSDTFSATLCDKNVFKNE